MGVLDVLALSGPGEGVVGQAGAGALDDVGDVHAEDLGAAVDKGEVQVALTGLTGLVLREGHVGLGGHLLLGQALDLPQLADAGRHLLELEIQTFHLLHRTILLALFPVGQRKNSPQRYGNL